MNEEFKEPLEKGSDVENSPESNSYQDYVKLGGIINENDYKSAINRAKVASKPNETLMLYVKNMIRIAGIELKNPNCSIDKITVLYDILRNDVRPEGAEHHHDEMTDQKIFVEVLRMLGDVESVDKMIKKHPNINFTYQRETDEE